VDIMKRHPSNASLQDHGCGALLAFCSCDTGMAAVIEATGEKAVCKAMESHSTHRKVQENGENFLNLMSQVSKQQEALMSVSVGKRGAQNEDAPNSKRARVDSVASLSILRDRARLSNPDHPH